MAFKIENFGSDASNIKSILGGVNYYRYFNKDNNTLTNPGYFPADLGLAIGDRITVIPSVKTNPDELYVVTNIANRTVTVTKIDTDGAVDSVNGKTGHVVLDARDVNAIPQLTTMPTASADLDGAIVQYVGTTDETYTNGYFYKCTGAGEPVVYSWTQTNVQQASDPLPSQTGNSGKFLTTDGTDASWSNKPLVNTTTETQYSIVTGGATGARDGHDIIIGEGATGGAFVGGGVIIGHRLKAGNYFNGVAIIAQGSFGTNDKTLGGSVMIGSGGISYTSASSYGIIVADSGHITNGSCGIVLGGTQNTVSADYAIQLGGTQQTNSDANTFKVGNANGNFEIMSADGTIPAARHASLPVADGTYVLKLVIASGVPTLSWVAE